jgi:choline-sulfatase
MVRCLCAAALAILLSCGSPSKRASEAKAVKKLRPFNVVVVTLDTLRADRLGCYGYKNIETPALDGLARRGTLFENAIASAPLTAPSHASMMTGLNPTAHKVRDTGNFVLSPSHTTLAQILRESGWDTAAFVGASVLKKRFGFHHGFATYDDEMPGPERRAVEVTDRAIRWLESQSGKPFFVWVHLFDPHSPYDPPSPFRERYKDRFYDGEIAYTDQQLGRFLDAVQKKSSPERTLIAILADHGESFSEHGEYAHGVFLYDATVRIPFLMAGPGVPPGLRVKQQARVIDLLPTLLELMGSKAPPQLQGANLIPAFTAKEMPARPAYIETLFSKINMGWAELRAVRTDRWKFIRAPKPELYNLIEDPGETTNVIARYPKELGELQGMLDSMTGSQPEKVETAVVDQRTLQELKSLGYVRGSSPGEYALTGEGVDPKDRVEVLRLLHLAMDIPAPAAERVSKLRRAIGQDPTNPALYSNLGDLYRSAGRPNDEMKLYLDAIRQGIRNAWLYSRVGAIYLRAGNNQEAVTFLEGAARANPSDHESLQNLAVVYRETGRIADAERVLNSILSSGEEYAPAFNELGMVAFQKRDLPAAREYFEKAARLDPAYQLNLARLYRMQGDTARARAAFAAFLAGPALRPEYRDVIPQIKRELAALP